MDLRKYILHRSYRNYIKWRKKNPNNFTTLKTIAAIDKISVGKMTYGELNVMTFGKADGHLKIGSYCSIAMDVTFLLSGNHDMKCVSTYPFDVFVYKDVPCSLSKGDILVDNDVWIGYGATILSGVHIGQGAVVATKALVTKDVPPYAVVGGVPARVIKYRFPKEIVEQLIRIDWDNMDKKVIRENRKILGMHITDKESMQKIISSLSVK